LNFSAMAVEGRLPPIGDLLVYKGKVLIGAKYEGVSFSPNSNNGRFFEAMVRTLDFVEKLPPTVKRYADQIREVVYDPPSTDRKVRDIYTNKLTVYTIGPDKDRPAPVIIYQSMVYTNPVDMAIALVTAGVYADRHRRRIDLRKQIRDYRESGKPTKSNEIALLEKKLAELNAAKDRSDEKVVSMYKCEKKKIFAAASKELKRPFNKYDLNSTCF